MMSNHDMAERNIDGSTALVTVLEAEKVLSEPTRAATVAFSTTLEGVEVHTSVPERHTGHMLRTLMCLGATAASVFGPAMVLKTTGAMPWEVSVSLAVLVAVLPLVYVLLSARRSKA